MTALGRRTWPRGFLREYMLDDLDKALLKILKTVNEDAGP